MENLFDQAQEITFDIVANTMGYNAVWVPSNGGPSVDGRVLFSDPNQKQQVGNINYLPANYSMEYKAGTFDGLKAGVDNNAIEVVEVCNLRFNVSQVSAKFDGKTFVALLVPEA